MELVRDYVRDHSEAAFAALVTRHVNLVYGAALRKTGNAAAAEEITQAVFVLLARKASQLRPGTVLAGWLHQTTRYTAASFLRAEARRRRREQEACMQSLVPEPAPELWPEIAPLLEDALGRLGHKDRDAVVLRFFEGKSFQEIGVVCGVTENAAKKRVTHGLEKLRRFFAGRGVVSTIGGLADMMATHSVAAAPAVLAATVTTAALSHGAVAGGATLTLIKGALKLMAWTKVKTAIIAVAGLVLATGVSIVVVERVRMEKEWVVQGKTESEWIRSIVYNDDDQQRTLWHSLGPKGIQMLLRAMRPPPTGFNEAQASASHDTRMRAARLLCELGDYKEDTSAASKVIQLLKAEKDDSVRGLELGYFAVPIQSMDEKDKAVLFPELLHAMQSLHSGVRNNALVALQFYPNRADTVVPLMVAALKDPSPMVRIMAVKALSKVDPQNSAKIDFVPVLVACLTGSPGDPESEANEALILLGDWHREPDLAVPALIQSLQSADPYLRANSAAALGKFGGQAKPAVAALKKALADSDVNVRRQAAAALRRIDAETLAK
ncbi:MAG TPA: sigma-70 family RNA polymerase sigma factor [Dongiaceae bacterium]|nr:sigma-70 family RNA polymerase sigma factor [Dongiaceae bacterium]